MSDTSNDTPTAAVAAAAREKVLITDERGRIIAVRRLSLLNYYALVRAMGESASNPAMMDLAVTAASVTRIDTLDFAFPQKECDVEFLMQCLDFEGIKAAGEGLRQLHSKSDNGTEAAKNSPGDPISS